jgi:hypothetical protein
MLIFSGRTLTPSMMLDVPTKPATNAEAGRS